MLWFAFAANCSRMTLTRYFYKSYIIGLFLRLSEQKVAGAQAKDILNRCTDSFPYLEIEAIAKYNKNTAECKILIKKGVSLFHCFTLIFKRAVSLFHCFTLILGTAVSLFRCFTVKLFHLFHLFHPIIFLSNSNFFLFFFSTIFTS